MSSQIFKKFLFIILIIAPFLNACGGKFGNARKSSPDPKERVKKNIEEGRGFRLSSVGKSGGTNFEFASSNPLWRASLDTIDFMPLASVNYSGGIIITDWYSTDQNSNESLKISIRFLTNEIRADALDIKIFNKVCKAQANCTISEKGGTLIPELNSKILKTATVYKKQNMDKDYKPYITSDPTN